MDDLTPARIWRDAPLADSPGPARMAIGEAQRTLWAAYRLAPEDPSYNMVLGGRLVGGVDPDILAEAFHIAISEREALHAAYPRLRAGCHDHAQGAVGRCEPEAMVRSGHRRTVRA